MACDSIEWRCLRDFSLRYSLVSCGSLWYIYWPAGMIIGVFLPCVVRLSDCNSSSHGHSASRACQESMRHAQACCGKVWRTCTSHGAEMNLSLDYAAAQSNHRSWADFYLDVVATDGNAQMLSRMAVAYVFPMFMLAVCIIRSVILFKRGERVDHEACPAPPPRPS